VAAAAMAAGSQDPQLNQQQQQEGPQAHLRCPRLLKQCWQAP
jgi:hypothetical protein